jgi:hypothetical protein
MLGASVATNIHGEIGYQALSRKAAAAAFWTNSLLASDAARSIDGWLRDMVESSATVYDKALDGIYIEAMREGATQALGGSYYHRLFDGGHDLGSAWQKVRDALPDDTFGQEVSGYISALWNDVVTPMGLPVVTFDKASFDAVAGQLHDTFGVSYGWVADLASFTATEGFGALIGGVALTLKWNDAQAEEFAEIVGALGVAAMVSANPILAVVVILGAARTFQLSHRERSMKAALKGLAAGSTVSGSLLATALAVGGPVWIGIIAGIVVSILVEKAHQHDLPERIAAEVLGQLREIDGKELLKGASELIPGLKGKPQKHEALGQPVE